MASGTRKKKEAKFPNLHRFIGGGKELLEPELPTLRQCLQYSLLTEERSLKQLTQREKFKEVNIKIRQIWMSANPLLVLQSEKYTLDRLVKEWKCAQNVAPDHSSVTSKHEFRLIGSII